MATPVARQGVKGDRCARGGLAGNRARVAGGPPRSGGVAPTTSQARSGSRSGRSAFQLGAQSSRAEYEGDLSTSLLLGLTDNELENLASEYEYDVQVNQRQKKEQLAADEEDDDEAEVDVQYEVSQMSRPRARACLSFEETKEERAGVLARCRRD